MKKSTKLKMFLFFAALLIVSINCQHQNGSRALIFFEGFAMGIEAEIGNPQVCAKTANITLTDFEAGYTAIRNVLTTYNALVEYNMNMI